MKKEIRLNNDIMDKYSTRNLLNYSQLIKYTELLTDGSFIAGGCFKNIFNNEEVKDVDIFFVDQESFNEGESHYLSKVGWKKIYETDNAVGFENTKDNLKIELIKKVFGQPGDILERFDFSIVKVALFKNTSLIELENANVSLIHTLLIRNDFFEHLHTKRLVLDPSLELEFPVGTFNRAFKYTNYGYGLCRESKLILLNQITKLTNIEDEDLEASLYKGFD